MVTFHMNEWLVDEARAPLFEVAYEWRLRDHAATWPTRRRLARLRSVGTASETESRHQAVLAYVLIVETLERPGRHRALERALATFRPGTTVGPFQMSDAPWGFEANVTQAAGMLDAEFGSRVPSPTELATFWNGAAWRQSGSALSYTTALRLAAVALQHAITPPPGWVHEEPATQ